MISGDLPLVLSEAQWAHLARAAREASKNAWSPHSGFRVGAAVCTAGGEPIAGCNVESDSYGLTQCAERNAMATAVANGVRPRELKAALIYVAGEAPLPPCGGCRQWLVEHLANDGVVISCCDGERTLCWQRDELMRDAFRMS